jgi:hypothetical protein
MYVRTEHMTQPLAPFNLTSKLGIKLINDLRSKAREFTAADTVSMEKSGHARCILHPSIE